MNEHEERDAAIVRDYASGDDTMEDIGKRHGVSRERVRQILKRNGYEERGLRGWAARRLERKEERAKRALSLYDEGLSIKDIAERVGVGASTVGLYLREAGKGRGRSWGMGVPRTPPPSEEQVEEALAMYESGVSGHEVARRTGLGHRRVFRLLRERGVTRSRGAQRMQRG